MPNRSRYVRNVLATLDPPTNGGNWRMSEEAVQVLCDFIEDMMQRLGDRAIELRSRCGRSTTQPADVLGAVRLMLPPEMAAPAVAYIRDTLRADKN